MAILQKSYLRIWIVTRNISLMQRLSQKILDGLNKNQMVNMQLLITNSGIIHGHGKTQRRLQELLHLSRESIDGQAFAVITRTSLYHDDYEPILRFISSLILLIGNGISKNRSLFNSQYFSFLSCSRYVLLDAVRKQTLTPGSILFN